jgi:hypothetical protein
MSAHIHQYTPLSLLRNCLQPHNRAQLGALHMSSTATAADVAAGTAAATKAFAHTPESRAKISAGNKVCVLVSMYTYASCVSV